MRDWLWDAVCDRFVGQHTEPLADFEFLKPIQGPVLLVIQRVEPGEQALDGFPWRGRCFGRDHGQDYDLIRLAKPSIAPVLIENREGCLTIRREPHLLEQSLELGTGSVGAVQNSVVRQRVHR